MPDTLALILLELDYPSLMEACRVNQQLQQICHNEAFWHQKLLRDFHQDLPRTDTGYRQQYEQLYYAQLSPNRMALEGRLDSLKKIYQYTGRLPTSQGADYAVANGHRDVVEWLIQHGVLPTSVGADLALDRTNWSMLRLLKSHGIQPMENKLVGWAGGSAPTTLETLFSIFPLTDRLANRAVFHASSVGNVPALEWYAQRGYFPAESLVAADQGHVNVLQWLYDHGMPPRFQHIKSAVLAGHLPVLNWLYSHGAPFFLGVNSDWILRPEVEQWLIEHEVPIRRIGW